jgi:5,10-methylene-tetrahydrofolate dehydrogenase/methenyl tetrahydrofolate cyclohydrolase
LQDDALRALIDPRIDAEGTHPAHLAATYARPPLVRLDARNSSERDEELIYPCTPLAVMLALRGVPGLLDLGVRAEQSLRGKTVTIINR